ncbi:26S proteasome non-ATPase regulatory subunit 8 [Lamellibrachia satsuma]|nr:26S proteasome non-ATPase regulatory subunit 8 [Lamellibrachia satsuma]
MASLRDAVTMYQTLTQEWNKRPPNLDRCGEHLGKLKIALTYLTFLPTQDTSATKQELLLARDILEVGAQWAIAKKDVAAFERYMAQLKCYYLDYRDDLPESAYKKVTRMTCLSRPTRRDDLPESAYKFQLLGLNLLRLLAQNKLAEFHTELELLPIKELHQNVYIKHPVSIEQYLMEGSYNKVFLARGNVPADSYNFFIDILLNTIRDEIAGCIEKAYEKIAFGEAARMLFFESEKPMRTYAQEHGWKLNSENFFYFVHEESKTEEHVPASDLVEKAISYAHELEMIV